MDMVVLVGLDFGLEIVILLGAVCVCCIFAFSDLNFASFATYRLSLSFALVVFFAPFVSILYQTIYI